MGPKSENLRTQEYIKLLAAHQSQIYAYILSMVVNYTEADEIMQETSMAMWKNFDRFEQGSDFLAWSTTIAYYQVLTFRRDRKRDSKVKFSDKFLFELKDRAPARLDLTNKRTEKLLECVKKLEKGDRELIELRYWQNLRARNIAERLNTGVRNVYYNLSRIQDLLVRCVRRSLAQEEL
ncbi:sigma-70 family RNA polymerase sigma factor [Anaerohalosphaera lusitana]|uniref:sigma-70 family RNA polymerase sigma factor n=1 Tax=Anaerohalosphaera lusitana TaxID=1936003 RepID=UPI001476341B|nr:sigma-70 family RNA polymerase sigma factor [Anaerohalosphaera lusitana]